MAVLSNTGIRAGASAAGGGGYQIEKSLRFDQGDGGYLARTPSSTGDTKKFTYSGWVKKCSLGGTQYLLAAISGGYPFIIGFETDYLYVYNPSGYTYSAQKLRDPNAWYHIVVAVDTDQSTDTDRVKTWINNARVTEYNTATHPTSGATTAFNTSTIPMTIGKYSSSLGSNFYLAEVNYIDGQQLDPSYFGETNEDTGQWVAKEFSGTYSIADTDGSSSPHVLVGATPNADSTVAFLNSNPTSSSFPLIQSSQAGNATVKVKFDSAVTGVTSIKFQGGGYAGGSTYTLKVNDTQIGGTHSTASLWAEVEHTISSTDITSIEITGSDGFALGQLKFNSSLVSGTASFGTLGVAGTNSFYLKFNGTDLGEDSSGNDNDWTATNLETRTGNPLYGYVPPGSGTEPYWIDIKPASTDLSYGTETLQGVLNGSESSGYIYNTGLLATGSGGTCFESILFDLRDEGTITSLRTHYYCYGTSYDPMHQVLLDADKQEISGSEDDLTGTAPSGGSEWFDFNGYNFSTGTQPRYIKIYYKDGNYTASGRQQLNIIEVNGTKLNNTKYANTDQNSTPNAEGDESTDTPTDFDDGGNGTGNYCTLSPFSSNGTLVQGNLQTHNGAGNFTGVSSWGFDSGKWYGEFTLGSSHSYPGIGFTYEGGIPSVGWMATQAPYFFVNDGGSSLSSYPGGAMTWNSGVAIPSTTFSPGVFQLALDCENGKGWIGYQDTWYNDEWNVTGSAGNPATGANPTFTLSTDKTWYFFLHANDTLWTANFGQRPFSYTKPSGFLSPNTYSIPDPTIKDPSKHFNPVAYSGNGTSGGGEENEITVGFNPDLVWIKQRNNQNSHSLYDSIRGASEVLTPNDVAEEETLTDLDSFDTDGFTVKGDSNRVNNTGSTYASWSWDAGSANVTNDASATGIGTIDSTYRANPSAGFSIVSYTGTGSAGTLAHGLNATPEMILVKRLSNTQNWVLGHPALAAAEGLYLNTYATPTSATDFFDSHSNDSSSVFSIGNNVRTGQSGDTYIAYAWAPVAGYSKFGSYTGNGSADGPMVLCGFKPALLIIKKTNSVGHWLLLDNERDPYNVADNKLAADLIDEENGSSVGGATLNAVDFLSNGFKLRSTTGSSNSSNDTFIFAAFADAPFKYANAR